MDKRIRKTYSPHINSAGGIFTPTTREKLISLVEKPKSGARENEFWYDIRRQVKAAMTDLAMICEIASDNQLKQMFEMKPLAQGTDSGKQQQEIDTNLRTFLRNLTQPQNKEKIDKKEYWKYILAVNIAMIGHDYFRQFPRYENSPLFERVFSDAEQVMNLIRELSYLEE